MAIYSEDSNPAPRVQIKLYFITKNKLSIYTSDI